VAGDLKTGTGNDFIDGKIYYAGQFNGQLMFFSEQCKIQENAWSIIMKIFDNENPHVTVAVKYGLFCCERVSET
jgi:hypothetical protein